MKGFMNSLLLSSPRNWRPAGFGDPFLLKKKNDRFPTTTLGNDGTGTSVRTAHSGFTLIELLVVVLIIGILSAVALPQYTRAVEKSRAVEALTIGKNLQDAIDVYVLSNGYQKVVFLKEKASYTKAELDIDLGSSLDCTGSAYCASKNFNYYAYCESSHCAIEIHRDSPNSVLYSMVYWKNNAGEWSKTCWTNHTDIGRGVCKGIEPQGWTYIDEL